MGTPARGFKLQPLGCVKSSRRRSPGRWGPLVVVCAAVLAGGCGESEREPPPARPQTKVLDLREARGKPGERLIVRVASVTVLRGRWSVRASLTNDTPTTLFLGRPHTDEPGTFGLVTARSAEQPGRLAPGLVATRYSPPLPRVLGPGETWRGRFEGPGVLRARTRLRVVFGSFWAPRGVRLAGRRHQLFRVVTERAFSVS